MITKLVMITSTKTSSVELEQRAALQHADDRAAIAPRSLNVSERARRQGWGVTLTRRPSQPRRS